MHSKDTGNIGRDTRYEVTQETRENFVMIAPFALWMALLSFLPANASAYSFRTIVVAVIALALYRWCGALKNAKIDLSGLIVGLIAGVLVLVLWVVPEFSQWYREHLIIGYKPFSGASPYDPKVCGWGHSLVRLIGSAFVIAPVEEFFYRKFLYKWTGADRRAFWVVVALFALEHDRIVAGALAGVVYGFLAIRKGIASAILAHVVTNLALGLYVMVFGHWEFW